MAQTKYPVSKIQRLVNTRNVDTYFPSMIGYVTSGTISMCTGDYHVNDRSPLNCLEWRLLWRVMDEYVNRFGNIHPDTLIEHGDVSIESYLNEVRAMFRALKGSYFYDMFRRDINALAIIDSCTNRCDMLHMRRNESSDMERASWKFYTYFQNLMYRELYEGTYIDLNWFNHINDSSVVKGISHFIRFCMDKLKEFNIGTTVINKFHFPEKLPSTSKIDYNLENMKTHVYRSIARVNCRLLMESTNTVAATAVAASTTTTTTTTTNNNSLKSIVPLQDYIPSYLNVSQITIPFRNELTVDMKDRITGKDDRDLLVKISTSSLIRKLYVQQQQEEYKVSFADYDTTFLDEDENSNDIKMTDSGINTGCPNSPSTTEEECKSSEDNWKDDYGSCGIDTFDDSADMMKRQRRLQGVKRILVEVNGCDDDDNDKTLVKKPCS